jgi:uncharacterized membrane protein
MATTLVYVLSFVVIFAPFILAVILTSRMPRKRKVILASAFVVLMAVLPFVAFWMAGDIGL